MKFKFITALAMILNMAALLIPTSSVAESSIKNQMPTIIADHTPENQTPTTTTTPSSFSRTRSTTTEVANNYIGAGITTSGLAAYSKFALGDDFSLRPQFLFEDLGEDFNGTVVVPVTYDFNTLGPRVSPFVGIGGSSQTRGDFDVGLNFATGLDYALSENFTATGLFDVQLFDDNDINAIFGLGLNF